MYFCFTVILFKVSLLEIIDLLKKTKKKKLPTNFWTVECVQTYASTHGGLI